MNVLSSLMLLTQDGADAVGAAADAASEATMEQSEVIAKSFELMGKGLIGIFVTITIIMICVFILMHLSKGEKSEKTEK
ncbi:MAG: hypothetical protein IKS10_03575 [Lachnospiraceae bacterium]|nr:hypothetical protein [Lachnospiraceae bacterium]